MKYWRGYLVAAIFAAISWGLMAFASGHTVLLDMIYPYVTRLVITYLADFTAGVSFCLWQVLLALLILAGVGCTVWVILRKRNPIRLIGWALAVVSFLFFANTALYGLNQYTSPLADDVRLQVADYTVSELSETTLFFRDKANELAAKVKRDSKGNPDFGTFEELAQQAGDGYAVLTYDKAISVFAGSAAPVKKLGFGFLYTAQHKTGVTVPLTGEAAVNPSVPSAVLPYAMCKELAHRMSIYSDTDASFAAFLAGTANPSEAFQYSAYLAAYRSCYDALSSIPTSTAQAAAKHADSGVSQQLRSDLQDYTAFFGNTAGKVKTLRTSDSVSAEDQSAGLVSFSEYSHPADLLTSWYIQEHVMPNYEEEEVPFDPLDPSQVDLTVTTPTESEEN